MKAGEMNVKKVANESKSLQRVLLFIYVCVLEKVPVSKNSKLMLILRAFALKKCHQINIYEYVKYIKCICVLRACII